MNSIIALTMFSGIAVSSCLFMSIYFLFVRRENKFLDATIGLIFISIALRISKSMLIYLVNGMSLTQISIVLLGYMIAAPLLLLYFKYLFSEQTKLKFYNVFHFVGPLILFLIIITDSYRANDVYIWGNYFFIAYLLYIGIRYIFNSKYKSRLTKWHHYLYYGMFGLIIAFSIQNFSRSQTYYTIGLIIASSIIYILFFIALNSPSVIKKKYTIKVNQRLIKNIKATLEKDKMYLHPGISIAQLSKALDTPEYLVSKAINSIYGKSFKDVVNGFRIADVTTKLTDPNFSDEKIENLAFDVGFNTTSAFYSAFKKETSMSPRAYQKMYQVF